MKTRHALGAVVLAAGLALSGCAGTPTFTATAGASGVSTDAPGDGGQSTADACAIVAQSIDEATAAFSAASPDDPDAVVSALESASGELVSLSEQVTNDDIAAFLPALRATFGLAAEAVAAAAAGDPSRMGEVTELGTSFQQAASTYEDLCLGDRP